MHTAHHVHSDTDKDTHIKGLKAFFGIGYKQPDTRFKRLAIKLLKDKKHLLLHKYFMLVGITTALLLALLSVKLFLFAFAIPVFSIHLANRLHRNFSHDKSGARNRWWLEYIIPMGGEWIHYDHHINAQQNKFSKCWYELDTGYIIVRVLENDFLLRRNKT
jgi:fatty-acid desaturase